MVGMSTLRLIPPEEALADWPHYEARIRRVVERADSPHDTDHILTCIQLGTMQLWRALVGDAIGVTELQTFPRYKRLLIYMVAGENAQDWLTGADQQLEAFAHSNGCTRMVFYGRVGWSKWCRAFGYEHTLVQMTKRVSGNGRKQSSSHTDNYD